MTPKWRFQQLNSKFKSKKAVSALLPKLRKTLKLVFPNYIIGMTEKRNTALMKAILKKAREYAEDGFGERL